MPTLMIQDESGISVEDYDVFVARIYRKVLVSIKRICETSGLDALQVKAIDEMLDDKIWMVALAATKED